MSKFKVGDKVRCVLDGLSYVTKGCIYEVVSMFNGWCRVVTDHGVIDGYREHVFELVESYLTLTPEEVFEHIRKGTKLQVRHTGKVGHKDWCDVVKPELTTYEVMVVAEWRIKPEPEIIELNGKKYREIVE